MQIIYEFRNENDVMPSNNYKTCIVQFSIVKIQYNSCLGFLRKVYGLLSVQILMTIAVGTVFMTSSTVKLYVQDK